MTTGNPLPVFTHLSTTVDGIRWISVNNLWINNFEVSKVDNSSIKPKVIHNLSTCVGHSVSLAKTGKKEKA